MSKGSEGAARGERRKEDMGRRKEKVAARVIRLVWGRTTTKAVVDIEEEKDKERIKTEEEKKWGNSHQKQNQNKTKKQIKK